MPDADHACGEPSREQSFETTVVQVRVRGGVRIMHRDDHGDTEQRTANCAQDDGTGEMGVDDIEPSAADRPDEPPESDGIDESTRRKRVHLGAKTVHFSPDLILQRAEDEELRSAGSRT